MDIEKLIDQLNAIGLSNGSSLGYHCRLFDDATTALSSLQEENEKLRAELEQMKRAARNYIPHDCHTCIDRSDPMCPGNRLKNSFDFRENCDKWTWRGPQNED